METMTFTRDELLNDLAVLDVPAEGVEVISDRLCDHSRWAVRHELIFRTPAQPAGEAWKVYYDVGATEQQDEQPWEHEEKIVATLVRATKKTITVWE